MRVRLLYALLAAAIGALLAMGCGSNNRTYALGGNPNQSPGTLSPQQRLPGNSVDQSNGLDRVTGELR